MARTVNLEVITPSKRFYKKDIELVIVRTLSGDEGFMAGHAWACKLLDIGELWIKEPGDPEYKVAAIAGGFIDVQHTIIIYTDAAEWASDIDMERALSDKALAEDWISHDQEHDPVEVDKAKISIAKAIVRMNVKQGGTRRKK